MRCFGYIPVDLLPSHLIFHVICFTVAFVQMLLIYSTHI
jgi:hypothetical protein